MAAETKLVFSNRFKSDVEEAFQYYKNINPSLGRKLKGCIKDGIANIRKSPLFAIRYHSIRCLPISTFPYMIHFKIEETHIVVLGFINTYLNPDNKWIDK